MRGEAAAQLGLLSALNLLSILALALARTRGQPTQPTLLLRLSGGGWALALGAQSLLLGQASRAEEQAHSPSCSPLAYSWPCTGAAGST